MTQLKSVLKLGTRKSLLAWAQSQAVATQIEALAESQLGKGVLRVELVGIETQGDRILDRPLSQLSKDEGGKEFFVAELDAALQSGTVDLTVHSLKDLSLHRPVEFVCAAIPKRENPRDVVLFGPHAAMRLDQGSLLKIGTSSPRRLENLPAFLKLALPSRGSVATSLDFLSIRGNVNSRLSRVHLDPTHGRYVDGVVLAFAGLIRLWKDPAGRIELKKLLQGVRWMVLPLAESPTAPGQGALAIECRREDLALCALLAKLNDPVTTLQVARERKLLEESGGGCHQRFGATCIETSALGPLFYVRGKDSVDRILNEVQWDPPAYPMGVGVQSFGSAVAWDGSVWKSGASLISVQGHWEGQAAFVAHARAAHTPKLLMGVRVWTSGVSSWFKLARRGLWVEGCAEGLGFENLISTLQEEVLGLPVLVQWKVLTHTGALKDWEDFGIEATATYGLDATYPSEARGALAVATHVFWASGSQYDALKGWAPTETHHACGPGKTAQHLRKQGIMPTVFPSVQEWKSWLRTN